MHLKPEVNLQENKYLRETNIAEITLVRLNKNAFFLKKTQR